ncbi:hypothetical protein BRADI_5g03752v3 [Brachypodium distachyon]|uniref:Uncharacterized protein n=1 Tax=Brachypodium distachyon TaxID=15368 RepID=A0A2K2CFC8_BRADI|nr:hypothetical protein BRADI_5g03752v3 [Brachypodium distachyon]
MCMYFSAVHPLSCSAGSALNLRVGLVLCLCVSSCGVLFAVLAIEPVFSGVFWFALLLVLFVSALAGWFSWTRQGHLGRVARSDVALAFPRDLLCLTRPFLLGAPLLGFQVSFLIGQMRSFSLLWTVVTAGGGAANGLKRG